MPWRGLVKLAIVWSFLLSCLADGGRPASSHSDGGGGGASAGPHPTAAIRAAVLDSVRSTGRADVLIVLRDGAPVDAPTQVLAEAAADAQEDVLRSLAETGFELRTRYEVLPLLAGSVDRAALETLGRHPAVEVVEEDAWLRPLGTHRPVSSLRPAPGLAEAVPSVGADWVHRELGLRGEGVTVAVLDTGIDNSHPDFAGRIVAQYCYSSSRSCAPNNVIEGPNAQDEAGHGTAVSGIIASAGKVSSIGVAPEADLVAVRVFRDEGDAQTSDIIKGLDFVLTRVGPLGIRVVNMSLGGGSGRGVNCDDQNTSMKAAFQRLVARQVAIFVATGNNGFPSEVSAPACISNSIAVGATYDAEYATGGGFCPQQRDVTPLTIACFTNRGRAMDILAPGLLISSSALGGGVTRPGAGTSYASPMAAGVAALMFQADPDLRPSEVERQMKVTGRKVKHLENDDEFPLIDAKAAVLSVLKGTPPTAVVSPSATSRATSTATQTGTRATSTATATATMPTGEPSRTATPTGEVTERPSATAADETTEPPTEGRELYLPALRRHAAGD